MINRLREALSSSSAFSLVGWLLLLPWSYLVTSTLRPTQEPSQIFLLIAPLLAHMVGGLFIFLGFQIQKRTNWRLGTIFTLFVFLMYGLARTTTVNILLTIDNPDYEVIPTLMLTATIVALVWQVMATIMIHYSRINLAIIGQLENQKKILDSEIELLKKQLVYLHEELPKQINTKVREVLDELANQASDTMANKQSSEFLLSNLLNDYVRPLSRDLRASKSFPKQERARITPVTAWESAKVFVREIADANAFAPITVSAIVTATGLPVILIFAGWDKLLTALLLITFGIWLVVRITAWIYSQIRTWLTLSTRLLVLVILWLLPGTLIGNLLRVDPDIQSNFVYLYAAGPLLTLVSSIVSAVYFAGISRRTAVIKTLDRETNYKDFEKQTLRQELKIAENQLIHLLHGRLQGQLNVLRTQIETGDAATAETFLEIEQSLKQIRDHNLPQQGFESTLNTLQRLWGRVANIKIDIPAEMMTKLKRQHFVGFATIEVIREVLNNSIKHGMARNIEIWVNQSVPQQLEVLVINDGALVKSNDKLGLGTQLLNDYCINWDIQGDDSHTEFHATIICPEYR